MSKRKIFIHTHKAYPNEDFVIDVQVPLSARKIDGILINAYDRLTGLKVKSGSKILRSPIKVRDYLGRKAKLIQYLSMNVIRNSSNSSADEIVELRNQFISALIDDYNAEVVAYPNSIFSVDDVTNKKVLFFNTHINPEKVYSGPIGTGQSLPPSDWDYNEEFRNLIGLRTIKNHLGYAYDRSDRSAALHFNEIKVGDKVWDVEDLKDWYRLFSHNMVLNDSATTSDYRTQFFADATNFEPATFLKAKVYVNEGAVQLVDAFTYFGEKYGYPDSDWYGFVPVTENQSFSFDVFLTAELALNRYVEYLTYSVSQKFVFDWDVSTVGEISVAFNSGRDVVIRDMPVELNNNTVNIHHNVIKINQLEQVNSYVRLVYKDMGKSVNPFFVKTYFFYETKE